MYSMLTIFCTTKKDSETIKMSTDIWTNALMQDLTDSDIEKFQEIVLRDVKNQSASDEDRAILGNNLDLWLYCLRIIRREIELQLTNHKLNLQLNLKELHDNGASKDEKDQLLFAEQRWRNNAMKFLTAIERKTLYVKMLIQDEDK